MNKLFLVLAFLSLAGTVKAETQTFVTSSSCTYGGATVSTGTWKRRIDNIDKSTTSVMGARSSVKITLPGGSRMVVIGYDTNVSTDPAVGPYGRTLSSAPANAAVTYELEASSALSIFAVAEDAAGVAGQRIHVEQCAPRTLLQ